MLEARPGARLAGLALSRRLRPASRLVPFLAAGELRHARPRALRRRADPRLRARRAGPQDVEVAGQRRRAAGRDASSTAPTSCASGWSAPTIPRTLRIGPEILKHQAEAYRRLRNTLRYLLGASTASPSRARRPTPRCRSSSAGCCTAWPSSTRWCARAVRRLRLPHALHRAAQFLRRRSLGLLFRRPQGRALLRRARTRRAGAPRARCSTELFACLTAWLAPVLCFTAEEAWLAAPTAGRRTASVHLRSLSRRSRRPGATTRWPRSGTTVARSAPRRHRRARARARREAHRLQPAGRSDGLCAGRACSRRSTALDLAEICHHLGRRRCVAGAAAGRRLHPARRRRRRRGGRAGRRARNASAAGGCCRRSAATTRAIRRSAGAAPTRSEAPAEHACAWALAIAAATLSCSISSAKWLDARRA